jgi:molybdenum cofactor synthesis domain-containing protein
VIPDDIEGIEEMFWEWSRETAGVDLIVSTGGTGFSPRDVTPEAAARVIERPAPNLMELARLRCGQKANLAWLSRGVAGVARRTLIITTPGSPKGAVETLEAVSDLVEHIVRLLRGEQPHQT